MPLGCSVPSHAPSGQQDRQNNTAVSYCQHLRQVNQQSIKYSIPCILPGTSHRVPSTHSPSCSVTRTNETWCIQYPGDLLPAMIPVSPLSPIAHRLTVAASPCSADANAGSSWIPPGTQIWISLQLPVSMKFVKTVCCRWLGKEEDE